jgi:hypothetical protein
MTISNKGYVVIKNYLSDKEVSGIKESFIPELFEYPYSQESSPKVGYAEIDEQVKTIEHGIRKYLLKQRMKVIKNRIIKTSFIEKTQGLVMIATYNVL